LTMHSREKEINGNIVIELKKPHGQGQGGPSVKMLVNSGKNKK